MGIPDHEYDYDENAETMLRLVEIWNIYDKIMSKVIEDNRDAIASFDNYVKAIYDEFSEIQNNLKPTYDDLKPTDDDDEI